MFFYGVFHCGNLACLLNPPTTVLPRFLHPTHDFYLYLYLIQAKRGFATDDVLKFCYLGYWGGWEVGRILGGGWGWVDWKKGGMLRAGYGFTEKQILHKPYIPDLPTYLLFYLETTHGSSIDPPPLPPPPPPTTTMTTHFKPFYTTSQEGLCH
jgi:hypothetical protein